MKRRPQKPLGKVTPVLRLVAVMTLVGAALLMAAAVFGGLSRMGVSVGASPSVLIHHHGPLMVSAFFGAVISMERAVAVRSPWSYLPPVAAVLGGLSLVVLSDIRVGSVSFTVAGVALVGVFGHLLSRRYEPFTLAMALGAVAWAAGNLLWALGVPVSEVVPWWAGFLVLAIFVGFVFSMVFAHAQVILPALSGLRVRHGVRFYVPLVVLHVATALRVAGDLGAIDGIRRAGGIGNAAAIALFVLVLASSVRRGSRRQ